MTSTLGSRCFITTDIPAISPPPPIGTTTASKRLSEVKASICSIISRAIVP